MSQPVNLNKVRKGRQRAEKRAESDRNAARFGRSKAEKLIQDAERAKVRDHLLDCQRV